MKKTFYQVYFFFSLFLLYIYLPYLFSEIVYYFHVRPLPFQFKINDTAFTFFYWIKVLFIDSILFALLVACILDDAKKGIAPSRVNYTSVFMIFVINFFPFLDKSRDLCHELFHNGSFAIYSSGTYFFYIINGLTAVISAILYIKMLRHKV